MPSSFEPVEVPPELRPDYVEPEPEPEKQPRSAEFYRGLVMLIGIALALCMMGAGVAWWVHPGAGLATMGLGIFIVLVLIELTSGGE